MLKGLSSLSHLPCYSFIDSVYPLDIGDFLGRRISNILTKKSNHFEMVTAMLVLI